MTILEQYTVAEKTKDFLAQWGLKQKFVAEMCGIPKITFSKFVNNKSALSERQLSRLTSYIDDYIKRNS